MGARLAAAKEDLVKEMALHQDNIVKLKAATTALQLEEQKLAAFRIRQESEEVEVPKDDKELVTQNNTGLTTRQEQEVLAAIGRCFGEQAGHIQQILGPIAEILVSVLRIKVDQPAAKPSQKVITMVSAMDDEAQAEKEHINAQEELESHQPKPEESKGESPEDTTKDTAMDAESERAAQTKRALEQEENAMVDDDLFTAQEHHDIEAAVKG